MAQNTLVAQLEEPEREEERPEEEAERALEPVEAKPETPAPMTPAEEVISKHSPSDVQAVRNGACSVDPKLEEAIRVNDTFNKARSGGPFPYKQDNTVFQNREESFRLNLRDITRVHNIAKFWVGARGYEARCRCGWRGISDKTITTDSAADRLRASLLLPHKTLD